MNSRPLDYDPVAPGYDRRFEVNPLAGVAGVLGELASRLEARRILEAGCGTGHWLGILGEPDRRLYGLDASAGMLAQASTKLKSAAHLALGRAEALPFPSGAFDLVYCANALHHFSQPQAFIGESRRALREGGILAIIGMSPPKHEDSWYIYQYFEGTFETDRKRYPSWGQVLDWIDAEGFRQAEWRQAERISAAMKGRAVLSDPFLRKEATSQLTLLSGVEYAAGMNRLQRVVEEAEREGLDMIFPVEINLYLLAAWV